MPSVPAIRRVLTIAGSDSGGGAGVQADLKAFARCGVHGMTAITMVTAQSTRGVDAVHAVPPEVVVAQVRSVAADIGNDAIKIGMLGDAETIAAVAGCLLQLPAGLPIVVDPVLVATSGASLLEPAALDALLHLIVPLATVLTPNLPEARKLVAAAGSTPSRTGGGAVARRDPHAGDDAPTHVDRDGVDPDPRGRDLDDGAADLARALHGLGAACVVITGGHRTSGADLVFDGLEITELDGPRHPRGSSHGSGCTHSAVLAAQLALGLSTLEAARLARAIAAEAVAHGLRELGDGEGPVDVLGGGRTSAGLGPWCLP